MSICFILPETVESLCMIVVIMIRIYVVDFYLARVIIIAS